MKAIVIYRSKTGFIKKYAEWISKALDAEIANAQDVNLSILKKYDVIVYGGGVYAVGINGIKSFKQFFPELKNQAIVVFAAGASPVRESTRQEILDNNFTKEEQGCIQFFYLRGGFDYKRLGFVDRLLMNVLKFKLKSKNKEQLTPDEKGMLAAYNQPVDFTQEKEIEALVGAVKQIQNKKMEE